MNKKTNWNSVATIVGFMLIGSSTLAQTDSKDNPPAFLMRISLKVFFSTSSDPTAYPLCLLNRSNVDSLGFQLPENAAKAAKKEGTSDTQADPRQPDLRISIQKVKDKPGYQIQLSVVGKGGGILFNENRQSEAPSEGYQSEGSLSIAASDKYTEVQKVAYVSTVKDGQTMFSRLDMTIAVGKAGLAMVVDSWTNPDGGRNLRYDAAFQRRELMRRIESSQEKGESALYESQLRMMEDQGRMDFQAKRQRANKEKQLLRNAVEGKTRKESQAVRKQEKPQPSKGIRPGI